MRCCISFGSVMQRTFAIIKPDAQPRAAAVKDAIVAAGFAIVEEKSTQMTQDQAKLFYEEHSSREFYQPLCDFMTSGPCTVMVLEKADAIAQWRAVLGPTDSTKAPPGTIRAKFGTDGRRNACHGSDSPASATREIAIFFPSRVSFVFLCLKEHPCDPLNTTKCT